MKVGVIGAGTMGQGIAKAFAQVDGYTVALCDIESIPFASPLIVIIFSLASPFPTSSATILP